MKNNICIFIVLFITSICNAQLDSYNLYKSFEIEISNPIAQNRTDTYVSIDLDKVKSVHPDFNADGFILYSDGVEIPSQFYNSAERKFICFVDDFDSQESKSYLIKYLKSGKIDHRYEPRTYAEVAMKVNAEYNGKIFVGDKFEYMDKVKVPDFHTDHDAMFKYEGPGWESDKVGYRFYIDWRNAVDIFGKKTDEMVLRKVGTKDLSAIDEKYHEMNDWGTDIFKVGNSLGLGSIATEFEGKPEKVSKRDSVICEITAKGPIMAEISTDYFGWEIGGIKYNLFSKVSIIAGSRLSNVKLNVTNGLENITTGFAKHKGTQFFKSAGSCDWQYIALYGNQTVVKDNLGIAVFYKKSNLMELNEDELNYKVKLKPGNDFAEYKYAAAWEQEPEGIKNIVQFKEYLSRVLAELNNPLTIEIK